MKKTLNNWIWFALFMVLILGAGIFLGRSRRTELGQSFDYSLDDFRKVDPALIHYRETDPIIPSVQAVSALAIASDGKLYVGGMNAVEVFPGSQRIAVEGAPSCLAVDDEGTLFAGMQDHVLVIAGEREPTVWPVPSEKAYLTSIAADEEFVYAADAGSRIIWRYGKEGGEPFEIGRKDPDKNVRGFFIPSPFFDIALSRADGSLWAVNPGYHALENYRPDGTLLSSWEAPGMRIEGFSGCCNPSHIALLPDGGFVTAEKGLPRVKIHNVDGSLRCVVAAPDLFAETVTGLDLAVGADGRILVLDRDRNQVRIFEEVK